MDNEDREILLTIASELQDLIYFTSRDVKAARDHADALLRYSEFIRKNAQNNSPDSSDKLKKLAEISRKHGG